MPALHGDKPIGSLTQGVQVTRQSAANGVFFKCSVRYWSRHRWPALLMLLGMSLGVAVVFAVDIANESARRAFALSLDAVTGRTTHQMVPAENTLDESIYTRLRTESAFRNSAPVVEGIVSVAGETLQVMGVDLFAEPVFRSNLSGGTIADIGSARDVTGRDVTGDSVQQGSRAALAILNSGSVLLAPATAARLGLSVGNTFNVVAKEKSHELRLTGLLNDDRQAALDNIAMVDISTAQHLLGMYGRLSRIDLVVNNNEELAGIRADFPSVKIIEAERLSQSLLQMTNAFHTNLLAMSLLALLVGAFLIYNTVTLSVLQRRPLFGMLRVAGVTRFELLCGVMFEIFCFALVGTVAGLLLGLLLGNALLGLVTRTINDLYFTLDVRRIDFGVLSVAKATLLGLGAALLAALAPAIEAANSPPVTVLQRSSIEKRAGAIVPWLTATGVLLLLTGAIIIWWSQSSLWAGFAALLFIVVGYSLLIPFALIGVAGIASRFANAPDKRGGPTVQYPLRSLTASLSRTSVAIAALAVAVSATAGVGIMIGSFRLSVADWLGQSLTSDIYIRSAHSLDNALPNSLVKEIEAIDGVTGLRMARGADVEAGALPTRLLALQLTGAAGDGLNFRQTASEYYWQEYSSADAIFVSEPFAWKSGLNAGDSLQLKTATGLRPFKIEGIFADYRAGKGLIMMRLDLYQRYWLDSGLSSIGVVLSAAATESGEAKQSIRRVLGSYSEPLMMRSDGEIKSMSLDIFDRTFAITHVLRLLTVGVAFIGILSALMALALERRREFAVLRAIGVTPQELRLLLFVQTGLMGIIAGVLALPLGYMMSRLLVNVINVRSFGWTMDFHVPLVVLLQTLLLAVVAALIAGWFPARQLSRIVPAEALRYQ